jgi:hypothetical protein
MEPSMSFLQITLRIDPNRRSTAVEVYERFKQTFLSDIPGARSKVLLMRDEDIQIMHEFETADQARSYLKSTFFEQDVVSSLQPLLSEPPEIRIYTSSRDHEVQHAFER